MIKQAALMILSLVGMVGWVIGLTISCMATGNWAFLGSVIYPAIVISLGLGLTLLLVAKTFPSPPGSALWALATYGSLSLTIGIILFLINKWLLPMIEADAKLQDLGRWLNGFGGSATESYFFLAVGIILLWVAVARLPTQQAWDGEGPTDEWPGSPLSQDSPGMM